MVIVDEDLTLLTEAVTEVAKKTLGKLTRRQNNWKSSITTKVNQLGETVAEVCNTMQVEIYGVESTDTLEAPVLFWLLRIEMIL